MESQKNAQLRLFATTAKGMEELMGKELASLGAHDVKVVRAGASFEGSLEVAYRACLESRIANRILLPLKTFPAPTPEKLYAGVKSIRWSDHLTPRQTIAVDFSSSLSQITHTHFGALKCKDAICDQFRSVAGERPSVDPLRADIRINVYLLKDEATVSLDLSGQSLHRRGYRAEGAPAPLKENLAAAVLICAGWPEALERARVDGKPLPAFCDPMCGSGTLVIEAASMALRRAPGIGREQWGFTAWKGHRPAIWESVLAAARAREVSDRKLLPRIVGYDRDPRAVRAAIGNVERAGLTAFAHVEKRSLDRLEPPPGSEAGGILAVNPPYGERMGAGTATRSESGAPTPSTEDELKPVYKLLGDTFKKNFSGWKCSVLTSSAALAHEIGLKAARRFPLFNGAIECRLLKFDMYAGTRRIFPAAAATSPMPNHGAGLIDGGDLLSP